MSASKKTTARTLATKKPAKRSGQRKPIARFEDLAEEAKQRIVDAHYRGRMECCRTLERWVRRLREQIGDMHRDLERVTRLVSQPSSLASAAIDVGCLNRVTNALERVEQEAQNLHVAGDWLGDEEDVAESLAKQEAEFARARNAETG